MTTDNLQNRLIQTSQTGGQWYNDTSPFSIPWLYVSDIYEIDYICHRYKTFWTYFSFSRQKLDLNPRPWDDGVSGKPLCHCHWSLLWLAVANSVAYARTYARGLYPWNTKGGKYHCMVDLLFDWSVISCLATDNFFFFLQNRLIQNSQTGGQWYSDTSPFRIPWLYVSDIYEIDYICHRYKTFWTSFSFSRQRLDLNPRPWDDEASGKPFCHCHWSLL
jgi:hypothetical protein